ncbi:MAG: MG2 domain-containing protein [Alloprevotella sp.]|nr:MG2 domain-containing protein [Alloprevotella sp.]
MEYIRKTALTLLTIIAFAMNIFAEGPRRPDFAFPKKVSEQSEKELNQALDKGNDPAALRALLNLTLAQNAIDSDRMPQSIARIDSVIPMLKSPSAKAMTQLLLARIYSDYYISSQWDIDRRPSTGEPAEGDYTEWNSDQFLARVSELLNAAMAAPEALLVTPLRDYDLLLDIPSKDARVEYMFYPSVLDFVGGQAIDLLDNFRNPQAMALAKEYRSTLIRLNTSHPAPLIVNEIAQATQGGGNLEEVKNRLLEIYRAHRSSAFCGEALIAYGQMVDNDNIDQCREAYGLISEFEKQYPTYIRINCLRNICANLLSRRATVAASDVVAPGDFMTIKADVYNIPELKVTLYRLPQSASYEDSYRLPGGIANSYVTKVGELKFSFTDTPPFLGRASDSLRIDSPGCYIAVPSAPGLKLKEYYDISRCTALSSGVLSFGSDKKAVVTDILTGKPVDDAQVMFRQDKDVSDIGHTSADGLLDLSLRWGGDGSIYPVKGSDRYAPRIWVSNHGEDNDTASRRFIKLYTDLPLYHPGDTVSFAAILYYVKGRESYASDGHVIDLTLRDANNQEVDTLSLRTDHFGRISGSFKLPDDGRLNGRYSIEARTRGIDEYMRFMVSDYKLPTFEAKVIDALSNEPSQGAVTLRGTAMTYSGMPVQDAKVDVEISRAYLWRIWDDIGEWEDVTLHAITGPDGSWSVIVPAEALAAAGQRAWFNAYVTITSTAGESQTATHAFTLGPSIRVEASLLKTYDVTDSLTLPVRVVDVSGNSLHGVEVAYSINADGKEIASGSFSSDKPVVDWRNIAPGIYEIKFSAEGDTATCSSIALYRPDINRSPSGALLWTPTKRVTLGVDDSAEILLGTSMDTTYVLFTLFDYEKVIEQRWITLPAGLHKMPVEAKHGGEPELRASFIAMGRYGSSNMEVDIEPAINPRKLTIKAESMRDHLTPGVEETWRFSVVNATGIPVESAVMIDMYNGALDALAYGKWGLPYVNFSSKTLRYNATRRGWNSMMMWPIGDNRRGETGYHLPQWQLYGQSLLPQTFRSRGYYNMNAPLMMKSARVMESASDDMEEAAMEEVALPAAGVSNDMIAEVGEDKGEVSVSMSAPEVEYRDSETPLALFRPMLATAADGSLELRFTVPNANATWLFQAIAWTDDMRLASLDASVLASKPVMVKLNAPRFLREGDRARVMASVMNATDEEQSVAVVIETFDPLTSKTISAVEQRVTIAPRATSLASIEAEALPGMVMTGVRVKASTATFSDGEQIPLPILPAATPIIDTETFYMGPDTDEASVTMPGTPEGASDIAATIEFCENPVWYVVTALPGLAKEEPITSPQAADALFSAAVAKGLLDRYPVIAEALKEWTSDGGSPAALTSMLERNADLKQLLLAATPWMQDAQSDNERMQRLALLFEPSQISRSINGSLDLLERLQCSDGGWAWMAQIKASSEWATYNVLSILATLRLNGFTPADRRLDEMTRKAVEYIDAEALKDSRKDPTYTMVNYGCLRSCFPGMKASTAVESLLARATQAVVKDWRNYELQSRPEAAMMLWRRDNKAVAREIIESLREYMVTSSDKGTFFPSLQNRAWGYLSYTANALRAFAAIEPGSPEVDGLRHWLVVQKQATDWGSSAGATEVVAAILSSSQEWLTEAKGTTVSVNGHKLAVSPIDRRLGYFRAPIAISDPEAPVTVSVVKKGHTPAWGSIFRCSTAPLRSVEASACPDLSIEKSIIGVDSLALGGKVTVRLVLHVNRNLNYVAITDERAACFEPVEQLPSAQYSEGVCFYLEPRDSRTSIFVSTMPKGTYVLSYDLYVNNAGSYASGIATAQSQYAPEIMARSVGQELSVK